MKSSRSNRESIWSVPHGWRTTYFLTFSVSNLTATCVIVTDEIVGRGGADPVAVFSAIAERVAVSGVALAITIFSVLEVLSFTMIAADYFRRKYLEPLKEKQREEGREQGRQEGRQEGREEGLEQGLAQAHAEWAKWNERRLKAAADGVPFSEPPPLNGTTPA